MSKSEKRQKRRIGSRPRRPSKPQAQRPISPNTARFSTTSAMPSTPDASSPAISCRPRPSWESSTRPPASPSPAPSTSSCSRASSSRRAGSGTHVLAHAETQGHVFGLLIPDLGRTEIFEPICQGMMRSPLARNHSLLWGHAMGEAEQQDHAAEQLCQQYIHQKVSGVFFAPLEYTASREQVNRRIAAALEKAGIPIVLLDRCYAPYPCRSRHDLVGIDNRAVGYVLTQHLLSVGAKRPAFLARAHSAPTVTARIAGYREALHAHGVCLKEDMVREGDTADPAFVQLVLKELRPDAILCANDLLAGRLIATLNRLGIDVPNEMRVTGIDDVKYASLLPVPLTTQHQNCHEIGAMAFSTMLERVANPSLPVRDILLQTSTIVRTSCGANLHQKHAKTR